MDASLSPIDWIFEAVKLCAPKSVHICSGSDIEKESLLKQMVDDGMLIKLNEKLRPRSYLARSDPNDTARTESCTYVCTLKKEDAGVNNNWMEPQEMKDILQGLYKDCMIDKTLYVIPFVMGPLDDPHSVYGIEITDSPYVVVHMGIMTNMGLPVFERILKRDVTVCKCLHSTGCKGDGWTSVTGEKLSLKWFSSTTKYISHFPEEAAVFSYGSGYGGNSLLGKKSISLRLGSWFGHRDDWYAEHMLLMSLQKKGGEKIYLTGGFPSASGKTNLALLQCTHPDYEVNMLGDDITWMRIEQGRLVGLNPEAGMFGVAPNTSKTTNPNAIETIKSDTIFTNVALTAEGDVWWEGLTELIPEDMLDWTGQPYQPGTKAAHPNSRFTVSLKQCPILDPTPGWVPISGIIFGGRRETLVPLVREAESWVQGVYYGSTICAQQTAAVAEAKVGELRYDPFAMLPFCGYDFGSFMRHWLNLADLEHPPKIFYVNWFKKDKAGKFIWPGFSANIYVLIWMYQRLMGEIEGTHTPIGLIPTDFDADPILFDIDKEGWLEQLDNDMVYLARYGERLPAELLWVNRLMTRELRNSA